MSFSDYLSSSSYSASGGYVKAQSRIYCSCGIPTRNFLNLSWRDLREWKCPICAGHKYMKQNKKKGEITVKAKYYTWCGDCDCMFKVMKDFYGKNARCLVCRDL